MLHESMASEQDSHAEQFGLLIQQTKPLQRMELPKIARAFQTQRDMLLTGLRIRNQ
jgi:hypothetical protein